MSRLNDDVLVLIVQETARQAEEDHRLTAREAWLKRSHALRCLALVSPTLRRIAQLELATYIYVNYRNYRMILDAPLNFLVTKRMLVSTLASPVEDHIVELLARCLYLEEMVVLQSGFWFRGLAALRHLHTLKLIGACIYPYLPIGKSECQLSTLVMQDSIFHRHNADSSFLAELRSVKHLRLWDSTLYDDEPMDISTSIMTAWMPSLVSLCYKERPGVKQFTEAIRPALPLAVNLKYFGAPLEELSSNLNALQHASISAGLMTLLVHPKDDPDYDDHYLSLLNMIGRWPIEQLDTFVYPAIDCPEDSVPLYEVVSALGMRGVKVKAWSPAAEARLVEDVNGEEIGELRFHSAM